ncbi:MAG: hypothetical protein ACI308_10785 [Muribaculaceae bacterium]
MRPHNSHSLIRRITIFATTIALWLGGFGVSSVSAQNISEIANSDPLLITGVIGTQNTYYYSSSGNGMASPLSNSIYANLNITAYGINMPFSFIYANNQTSFSYPRFSFNISPSYKGLTLHLGRHSMAFSNYVYNIPFEGVGIEYNGKLLRLGAFYGTLQKAINEDPTDPASRMGQYKRSGLGVKIGVGNRSKYLDLYFLRAKDKMGSLDEGWWDRINPKENIVVGVKGRFNVKRFLSLSTNAAFSLFSEDLRSSRLELERLNNWDKLFDVRYSTLYRFAGDVSLNFNTPHLSGAVSYKMVQPDYKSLGANYISNNVQSLGVMLSSSMFRGRVNLSGNFSAQADNLDGNQLYTTKGFIYAGTANLNLSENLGLNLSYNGYRQLQSDGTEHVNDTTRVNRIMHAFTASPSYNIMGDQLSHYFGGAFSYNMNKDLNTFHEGAGDVTTRAFSVNYTMGILSNGLNISAGYGNQNSKSEESDFTTNMVNVGLSKSLLKNRNLTLSADLSAAINKYDDQKTVSYGLTAQASYLLKEAHQFSFGATMSKYNDYYITSQTSYNGFDLQLSLNYTYSFTLIHLKKKSKVEQ